MSSFYLLNTFITEYFYHNIAAWNVQSGKFYPFYHLSEIFDKTLYICIWICACIFLKWLIPISSNSYLDQTINLFLKPRIPWQANKNREWRIVNGINQFISILVFIGMSLSTNYNISFYFISVSFSLLLSFVSRIRIVAEMLTCLL